MSAVKLCMPQNWRQLVGEAMKKIITEYYQAPSSSRSASLVLKLVEKHWRHVDQEVFHSNIHYYTVLAKTTDYLLRFLDPTIDWFLLFERIEYGTKHVDVDIAYKQDEMCIIRKFILQEDEAFYSYYMNRIAAAFESERRESSKTVAVEFCSLLTGQRQIQAVVAQNRLKQLKTK
ncbi:hypothetical protein AT864_02905 [Anoxybacillus sp. P3H1B]|uniref:hypothetical protein n=1 Tax=Anoxybacillaceae TaxID=3120669 RepID=UPI00079AD5AE|nr:MULTISPECIES: hypothetical protein [Anoxybacillus]KXG08797.1 hypothetical protein AT864_02905 [Anoxybacillus sp. P3H1B]MBB3906959.1 hypothetical protein [Anoxybacillus rupiensis]QHC05156.1 hypothetical protein GRQ40_15120 [Anoxybacillus sp. PDR2]